MIKKNEYQGGKKDAPDFSLLEKISTYFWDTKTFRSTSTEIIDSFASFRDALKKQISSGEYFLIAIGIQEGFYSTPYFGTFQTDEDFLSIFNIEKKQYDKQSETNKEIAKTVETFFKSRKSFFPSIKNLYHYVYIPSDIDVKNYTKLQTENMQRLMHRDVAVEIEKAVGKENLNTINISLDNFLNEISKELKSYTYRKNSERQDRITMSDLTEKILESYFSKKVLTKSDSKVSIDTMSSGEKHKALIDICYAFLGKNSEHDRKIILAIDEPENSLHVSACYDQFEKLKNVSSRNHQVLITTHWYGFLPVTGEGIAHNIYENDSENKREISSYHLGNYQEEIILNKKHGNHKLPNDVFLKSKYDLVQSIISSIRTKNPYNYILVEGSSDKIYLEHYLSNYIEEKRLRIMPLGGCGEVIHIMNLLSSSMEDKDNDIGGKVLALIDTDIQRCNVDWKENPIFIFKRLLFIESEDDVSLVNISDSRVSPETEIEDSLDPQLFLETLKIFLNSKEDDYKFITDMKNVSAKCSYNAIDYTSSQRKKVKNFLSAENNNKKNFAKKYVSISNNEKTPNIVIEILKIFDWSLPKTDNVQNETEKSLIYRKKRRIS